MWVWTRKVNLIRTRVGRPSRRNCSCEIFRILMRQESNSLLQYWHWYFTVNPYKIGFGQRKQLSYNTSELDIVMLNFSRKLKQRLVTEFKMRNLFTGLTADKNGWVTSWYNLKLRHTLTVSWLAVISWEFNSPNVSKKLLLIPLCQRLFK